MTLAEMQFIPPDLRPAGAEIFLLLMACVLLLVGVFVKDKKNTLSFTLAQLTLVGSALLIWAQTSDQIVYTFGGMYVSDLMSSLLKLMLCLVVMIVFFYTRAYVQARPQMARPEYYTLSLFATLGMMVMISASNFIVIYIGLELLSLSLYALVALDRDSLPATEAAMKYFVLGALASGLLLYGISMVYGATGTLDIRTLAAIVNSPEFAASPSSKMVLLFGVIFIVAGFAFKLGAAPFHMWIPDVYHGAPTAVTLFIGSAPKLAAFAIVIRVLVGGLLMQAGQWQMMLLFLAILSMAVGNFAAIAQTNLKRMLAYSAIGHMGFMLLGLATGLTSGNLEHALDAHSASLFYVITYVITSTCAFGMILLLSRSGIESDEIKDFSGLNQRNPWFAGVMLMTMFSMAGIPFFVGFMAKFSVLQAVVMTGHVWLAVLAVVFSLIGAYYYLRVVKVMYFDPPADTTVIAAPVNLKIFLSINGLAIAAFGLFPNQLMWLCKYALSVSL